MKDKDAFKPSLAVNRFTRAIAPQHEPEVQEAEEVFKQARSKSREALMLDVRLADGTIESFDYPSLRRMSYDPAGAITLRFGKSEVLAEGRNLHLLRDAISEHRARFISEGTEAGRDIKTDGEAHINRITISEGDDE